LVVPHIANDERSGAQYVLTHTAGQADAARGALHIIRSCFHQHQHRLASLLGCAGSGDERQQQSINYSYYYHF
jgi:hypothetical protein